MKIAKLLTLTAVLVVVGAAQGDIGWNPVTDGGDNTWENPNSWHDGALGPGFIPTASDNVLINRYVFNLASLDAGTAGLTLSSAGVGNLMVIGWINPDALTIQEGTLSMLNGSTLAVSQLQMGNDADVAGTLNMEGNASATVNQMWLGTAGGTATGTINMSGTSSLTLSAPLQGLSGGSRIFMDGGATLTIPSGDTGWANSSFLAVGAGDSIQTTDIGGGTIQYTVIPEPATLGLVVMMGGGLLFFRTKFQI